MTIACAPTGTVSHDIIHDATLCKCGYNVGSLGLASWGSQGRMGSREMGGFGIGWQTTRLLGVV